MRRPRFFPLRLPHPLSPAPVYGDPVPAARKIAAALLALKAEADAAGLKMLGYLIGSAWIEAERIARKDE